MDKLGISACKKGAIDIIMWYTEASRLRNQQETGGPKSIWVIPAIDEKRGRSDLWLPASGPYFRGRT